MSDGIKNYLSSYKKCLGKCIYFKAGASMSVLTRKYVMRFKAFAKFCSKLDDVRPSQNCFRRNFSSHSDSNSSFIVFFLNPGSESLYHISLCMFLCSKFGCFLIQQIIFAFFQPIASFSQCVSVYSNFRCITYFLHLRIFVATSVRVRKNNEIRRSEFVAYRRSKD